MTIRCGVLDDALRRADMESARRCPSSADEGRKPTSNRESSALGGDGRVCVDRRDHQASCRDMGVVRLGVTPLSFDPALETRSIESPRARLRVMASGSHGTVICSHHERAGGCVVGIVLREQRLATRSAALGAGGGWCRATPTILRRLRLDLTAVNLVYARSGDVVAHVQETPASRKRPDRAARRRRQCPKARPPVGSKRSAEH